MYHFSPKVWKMSNITAGSPPATHIPLIYLVSNFFALSVSIRLAAWKIFQEIFSHSDEGVNELSVIQRMSSRSNENSVATFDDENVGDGEESEVCQLQSVVTVQEERQSSSASLS